MEKVDITKLLLDNYSNEELICWVSDELRKTLNAASKADNLEMFMPIIVEQSVYLSAIATRIRGGNKETTVL